MAAQRKVSVTVRLTPVVLAAVDKEAQRRSRAEDREVTRTEVIEARLSSMVQREPTTAAKHGACSHPKGMLTIFGWGTMCECGQRVR